MENRHPKHLSYSSLSKFETCPRCWWLGYVKNIWPPKNENLIFGKKIHEATYKFIKTGEQPLDTIQYTSTFKKLYPNPTFVAIEQEFLVPFINPLTKEELPVPIKGYIDWVDESGWLHDIKTSSRPYARNRVDDDKQLTLYAYAYRRLFGKEERGVRFDVFVKNVKPICIPYSSCRTDEQIAAAWNWAQDIWWQIERMVKDGNPPEKHTQNCWNPDYEKGGVENASIM